MNGERLRPSFVACGGRTLRMSGAGSFDVESRDREMTILSFGYWNSVKGTAENREEYAP
jgi:hypothetical protein